MEQFVLHFVLVAAIGVDLVLQLSGDQLVVKHVVHQRLSLGLLLEFLNMLLGCLQLSRKGFEGRAVAHLESARGSRSNSADVGLVLLTIGELLLIPVQ